MSKKTQTDRLRRARKLAKRPKTKTVVEVFTPVNRHQNRKASRVLLDRQSRTWSEWKETMKEYRKPRKRNKADPFVVPDPPKSVRTVENPGKRAKQYLRTTKPHKRGGTSRPVCPDKAPRGQR